MRWHVDISSIGSGDQKTRFCVEAEQWQKALQLVRAKRGDDGPFGHFSIELLDDGFRAIDPLTRTRYVVQRAPDDAPLIDGSAVAKSEAVDEEKTSVGGKPKADASSAGTASRPRARASNRGTTSRASERGRLARGKAPSIPDDPVPRTAEESKASKVDGGRTLTSSSSPTNGAATTTEPTKPISTPPRRSEVPLVAPKPMQAETAFERMTGGSAVALPTSVSASAELQTEVLPLFKVLSRRSEDPTPSSPLTYREMALTVASTTSLRDAEAIARAQFEIIRNAISGAPKGKFIQLAVFDHEFTGKPSRAPIVTLSFKDWRNVEPDLRFPQRDGAGPTSVRSSAPSMPPASMPTTAMPSTAAPSAMAPSTVEAPTVPVLPDTVVRNIVPSSLARPTVEPQTLPATTIPEPSRPMEAAPTSSETSLPEPAPEQPGPVTAAAAPEPAAEVIKPAPIIAIVGSNEPAVDAEKPEPPKESAPPPEAAAPASALEEAAPATVPSQPPPAPPAPPPPAPPDPTSTAAPAPAPASTPPPARPASAPPPAAPPDPTPSQLRANAKEMAGDDEKTLVKPSSPPPAPEPATTASQPPRAEAPPANEHVVNKTTKMAAVSAPPPAPASAPPPAGAQPVSQIPPAPPVARVPSVPPPAEARPASIPPASALPRPASIPPAGPPAAPLLVRQPIGPRRSGDDLITDLFEACSDLAFLNDTLEAADFALALVLDSIPSTVALCSFFDINTREMVVVRQAVSPAFTSLPNVLTLRASEFTPLIAKTMRAGRSLVVPASDCGIFAEDARWRALGHAPRSAISTPVAAGGRYLGLIEVADPLDDSPFTEADGHALTYIGGQFSEYLAQREIDVTPERILRPKLNQLARR
jgi:hypothetical protein